MENKIYIPFEATHPGSLIKDELKHRGILKHQVLQTMFKRSIDRCNLSNMLFGKNITRQKGHSRRALQQQKKTLHIRNVLIFSGEYRNRTDDLLTASQTL
jgi:hypothetical protein